MLVKVLKVIEQGANPFEPQKKPQPMIWIGCGFSKEQTLRLIGI